jgi:hypothetical protein
MSAAISSCALGTTWAIGIFSAIYGLYVSISFNE